MVARFAHDSGGNALLAIELARAMLRLPTLPGPADDLPVVASMQELVGRHPRRAGRRRAGMRCGSPRC